MPTNVVQDRLGDFFVRDGLITEEQLRQGLEQARTERSRLGSALVGLGFVEEADLTRALAKQYRVPAVDLDKIEVDGKIIRLVSGAVAHKHLVLPLRKVGRTLTLAMVNPTDQSAIDDLKFITRLDIEPVIAGELTLRANLEKYYESVDDQMADLLDEFHEEDVEFVDDDEDDVSVATLQAEVDKAPVVKFINGLLTDAVVKGVSDIHIEPYERELRVRYRIDGALQEVMKPPLKMKSRRCAPFGRLMAEE